MLDSSKKRKYDWKSIRAEQNTAKTKCGRKTYKTGRIKEKEDDTECSQEETEVREVRIAVVTGASSGMGKEFVYQIQKKYKKIQEIWVIARREKELEKLPQTPIPLRILPLDLTKEEDQKAYREKLKEENPRICMLIHCAGIGYLGRMDKISAEDQIKETMINCTGLTAVTLYSLPYLSAGSRVIELVSSSAFAPQPGFGVYAATKAYGLSFSRTLSAELRKRKIIVTAVCPGPVDTPFFKNAEREAKRPAFKNLFLADPEKVAEKAMYDSRSGKTLSIYGGWMKIWYVLAKLIPHPIITYILANVEKNKKKG